MTKNVNGWVDGTSVEIHGLEVDIHSRKHRSMGRNIKYSTTRVNTTRGNNKGQNGKVHGTRSPCSMTA